MIPLSAAPEALFQAVGERNRLRLLRLLRQEELNVRELVAILGLKQPAVSKHLAVLREAGWLRLRREGTWNWYEAAPPADFAGGAALMQEVMRTADTLTEAAGDDEVLDRVLSDRERRAQDFFAGIAERWDSIRAAYEHADIQAGVVAALAAPGLEVVDIGTGTGALLPLLAGAADRIVAVDSSESMLARARRLCEEQGLAGVTFRLADIQELPFAEGRFAAAHCSMVLHHVARPARAVAEMARVVRPGGKVVVIAFTQHDLTWMREELAHQRLGFAREEIEEMLSAAGLRLRRYLVRGVLSNRELPEHPAIRRQGENWAWPDVFLAEAVKPAVGPRPALAGRDDD